jgi:transaldolase
MLYIDSCSIADIRAAFDLGVVSGVTTNPILANKAGVKYDGSLINGILAVSAGPVSAQTGLIPIAGYAEKAHIIASSLSDDRVVVKIPCTLAGLRLAAALESEGVRTNITAVMSVEQAVMAAAVGASYVSLFWGRIEDTAPSMAHNTIMKARKCLYKSGCRIIVGSIRKPSQVADALVAGAHIVTASWPILQEMVNHPTTTKTIADFDAAWGEQECKP